MNETQDGSSGLPVSRSAAVTQSGFVLVCTTSCGTQRVHNKLWNTTCGVDEVSGTKMVQSEEPLGNSRAVTTAVRSRQTHTKQTHSQIQTHIVCIALYVLC